MFEVCNQQNVHLPNYVWEHFFQALEDADSLEMDKTFLLDPLNWLD